MDPSEIRKKIRRFRVLILGRANAGKTSVLRRVCNTRENPEIYNSAGEKIDATVLEASTERGLHDIENEMVFPSNPGFVFHDSRGFEAGSEKEFEQVKAFIKERSKETKMSSQLHTIWYCIPMDEAHRSFTKGEIKFFSECDTGNIPVIVLFTKFDALYDTAYAQLKSKGKSMEEAEELAPKHAEESFAIGSQLKFLYHSKEIQHHPKCHICLPNMNKEDADCGPLIELTARTLDNEALQQLFVSTQRTNLEICMKYAVERGLIECLDSAEITSQYQDRMIERLGAWFPHVRAWSDLSYLSDRRAELGINILKTEDLYEHHATEMRSRLLSVAAGSSTIENIVQLGSAVVIIFEHSFYIYDKRRYLQDQQKSDPSYYLALEQYMASPHAAAVKEGVSAAVQAYEEAVTAASHAYEEAMRTAVYPYEGNLPTWMTKLPFKPFKRKAKEAFEGSREEEKRILSSQAKAELSKNILAITLNHRMPRPQF